MNGIIEQSVVYKTDKGTPVTDSIKVAGVFGKQHKNIIQAIRNLLGSAENSAHARWFYESTYLDAQGKKRPRVLFSQAVETSQDSILIGELAKLICQNGVDIGEKRLFAWLRSSGYLCQQGERYNQPTQKALEKGLFELRKVTINVGDHTKVRTTTKVTGKGQVYFVNKFLYNQEQKQ